MSGGLSKYTKKSQKKRGRPAGKAQSAKSKNQGSDNEFNLGMDSNSEDVFNVFDNESAKVTKRSKGRAKRGRKAAAKELEDDGFFSSASDN